MKKVFIILSVLAFLFLVGCNARETVSELPEQVSETIENTEDDVTSEEESNNNAGDALLEETMEEFWGNETSSEETEDNVDTELSLELQSTDNSKVNVILNLSGTYTDIVGNTNNYLYQIPQFNADSDSAKVLNERIVEDLYDVINDEVQTIPTGCSLFCYSVTYEVVEYDNIVAIIASVPYPNDVFLRFAYSYDFANEKEVTNTELLAMRNLTEEDFITESLRREKEYFQRQVDSIYPGTAEEEMNAWMQSAVNDTTVDLPMYIGADGILYVYVPFPSLAGADWYYSLEQF